VPELHAGDPAWIGPFRLRERLGDGNGYGASRLGPLYLGRSPLAHLVTIRMLGPEVAADKALRARLTRDVAAAREAAGPHVAPLVGADLNGPAPWVAWEWVPGESLAGAVAQRGPLPWPAFAALATQLAEGIWSLHEAGVVHGDLTPGSVFLAKDGAVVTGFGVGAAVAALRAAAAATLPGGVLAFLSPEQAAAGEATPASDMFSLGAVLAYAARGTGLSLVWERAGKGHAIDYDHPDLDGVPDFLQPLIERCLRADPEHRAPSGGFAALLATTIRAVPARRIAP
jgi:eukaryotic-like serine/threonine-protein kinase